MQNHLVLRISGGCLSMGILRRMGVVKFLIFFSPPPEFLKPMDVTGVPVSLADSAPFVFVPEAVAYLQNIPALGSALQHAHAIAGLLQRVDDGEK